jgi:hypothetical protein
MNLKFSLIKGLVLTGTLVVLSSLQACSQKNELTENDFKFDGPLGSQGAVIEKLGENLFRVILGHAPEQPEWNNKLNFQITRNARGNDLVLIVEGPPRYAMNEYFYSWSYDMENWNPVHWKAGFRVSPELDTLVFPVFEQDQVYVGHQVPISYEQIEEFIAGIQASEYVNVDTLGKSLGGRNLYRLTITDPSGDIPFKNRWVHYFSNSHPGEHNAQWRMIGKIEWILSEEGRDFRERSISHFVLMMSPDGPHNGWYRVNAQGVDMNRSYFPGGSDREKQAHEAYIFQHDLEKIMESESPATTVWGHHTWGGPVEPLLYFVEDSRVGPWTEWRDILQELAPETLIKPLAVRQGTPGYGSVSWENGPHAQFGITTVLCEGAGAIYTKEENKESGKLLIQSLARYYKGTIN